MMTCKVPGCEGGALTQDRCYDHCIVCPRCNEEPCNGDLENPMCVRCQIIPTDAKQMYRVEKFTPTHCPSCGRKFYKEGYDWGRRIYDENHKIIETTGYYLCICLGCKEDFHMKPLEIYHLTSKEEAERLCREEGFVNLITCWGVGNMAQDSHAVHDTDKLIIKSLKCE